MKLQTVISSVALVAAMTFSGGVFAQSMIGGVAIPEENLADFNAKCAAIASAATESLASSEDDLTETGSVVSGEGNQFVTDPDLANKDNLDQLLASLTPEQCKEAGLLPGSPAVTTQ
jgi:hypothetical protein